jgi:hypothetical protein
MAIDISMAIFSRRYLQYEFNLSNHMMYVEEASVTV